ncbi:MAG TPA: DUF2164 domain-containing protein [Rhodothermales bacterium]|nr:DUF2164 domain-containing protein [Rhodothermales bacterium]
MPITLPDETKEELVASIKHYFLDERDEEIGDLQASLILDFILKEIGPSIYNQAVRDAQASLQGTVADLDATLYEPELGYTAERRTRRNARK